ncbi:tetratricopeptide repeat protein [Paracoccaceae bacterium GXU_MW_L88]
MGKAAQLASPAHHAQRLNLLGHICFWTSRFEDAEKYARQALTIYDRGHEKHSSNHASSMMALVEVIQMERSKIDECILLCREALRIFTRALGSNHFRTLEAKYWLERLESTP